MLARLLCVLDPKEFGYRCGFYIPTYIFSMEITGMQIN